MADYSEEIASALEMITDAGELCTVIRPNASDHATRPWDEPEVDIDNPDATFLNVPVCFVPLNRVDFESMLQVKGTEIPQGRQQGLMPGAVPFIPSTKDVIVRGSDSRRYSVINYDEINPAGQPILYIIQLHEE